MGSLHQMTPRRRLVPLVVIAASLAATPSAAAAPRVVAVDGFRYVSDPGGPSDYVVLEVRTRDATQARLQWRGVGGARSSVQNGRVGIGFNRRGTRYVVKVRACRRSKCSRARRFSGRFGVIRTSSEPRPNSPPQGGSSSLLDPLTGLPIALPPVLDPEPILGLLPRG